MANEDAKTGICCFCGGIYTNYGNSPEPLMSAPNRCCDVCNATIVVQERLRRVPGNKKDGE